MLLLGVGLGECLGLGLLACGQSVAGRLQSLLLHGAPHLATPCLTFVGCQRLGGFTSPNKTVALSSYPDPVTRADASELVNATSFVFSLDDLQSTSKGAWENNLWADMLDFVP